MGAAEAAGVGTSIASAEAAEGAVERRPRGAAG